MFAVGADPFTGSFFQIWKQPHSEQDLPVLVIDNMGVRPWPEPLGLPHQTCRLIAETTERYRLAREHGNPKPNIDAGTICLFAHSLGFPGDIDMEIYKVLD
jgi:hypothetical protein